MSGAGGHIVHDLLIGLAHVAVGIMMPFRRDGRFLMDFLFGFPFFMSGSFAGAS